MDIFTGVSAATTRGLSLPSLVIACLLGVFMPMIVKKAYPRPLAGIPYNKQAAGRVMGDLTEIGERTKSSQGMRPWFLEQAARHGSAITQIFLGPFAKPAILISDYREANDILSRRDAVDFKRGKKVDVFSSILPHAHPAMETFDPRFRGSRDLVRDLMAPSFLNTVNAPHTYEVACNLIELWRVKQRIAKGRPFNVSRDIVEFSFDSILSAATGLGPEGGDVKRQLHHLESIEGGLTDAFHEAPLNKRISLPSAQTSAKLAALGVDEESLWKGFYMPWPRLYHRINQLRPVVRKAGRTLRGFIEAQVAAAVPTLLKGGEPQCALDYVVQREIQAAQKSGREPVYNYPRIRDEIYGYLIAGHDTSAGSLTWLVRRLLAHPEEQIKIRQDLRLAYDTAWQQKRLPTASELIKHAPYLDAFIEEVLRFDCPVVTIMVTTRQDTLVLGHPVPGDTQVFLNLTGPSLNMPFVAVDESVRSPSSQKHKPARENWDSSHPGVFRPERWLVKDADGRVRFDPSSGPTLAFSLGYLELRIMLTLLIWSFELDVPEELVSWETYDSLVTAPRQCILRVTEPGTNGQ